MLFSASLTTLHMLCENFDWCHWTCSFSQNCSQFFLPWWRRCSSISSSTTRPWHLFESNWLPNNSMPGCLNQSEKRKLYLPVSSTHSSIWLPNPPPAWFHKIWTIVTQSLGSFVTFPSRPWKSSTKKRFPLIHWGNGRYVCHSGVLIVKNVIGVDWDLSERCSHVAFATRSWRANLPTHWGMRIKNSFVGGLLITVRKYRKAMNTV